MAHQQPGGIITEKGVGASMNDPGWFDWSYTGVNFDLAGNGGDECQLFIPVWQRIFESVVTTIMSGIIIMMAFMRLTLPNITHKSNRDYCGKRILLVIMCLTFGIELGFKFATRQMIYLLNPCHLATILQIFCLAAPPSKLVTTVFRLHLHMLSGAPIAILFPVINTRLLPFEIEVYYIQHVLMLIIPVYLIITGGVYTPEPLWDFSWAAVSVGNMYVYHFITLQYLAYVSKVNLNNMLCPAISDPFYGPYYRICAVGHQTLALPILAKVMSWACKTISPHTVYDLEETKVIDLFYGHVTEKGDNTEDVDQNQKDVLLKNQKLNNVKLRNNSADVTTPNGEISEHTKQPSNGHIKSS